METEKGILLTAISGKQYLLPGGGANKGESRFRAAIRELEEETGLLAYDAKVLFRHKSKSHEHTVVLCKARGKLRPKQEVKHLAYYPKDKVPMSKGTIDIINKYLEWKETN